VRIEALLPTEFQIVQEWENRKLVVSGFHALLEIMLAIKERAGWAPCVDADLQKMLKRVEINNAHIGIFLYIPLGVEKPGVGNEPPFAFCQCPHVKSKIYLGIHTCYAL
jgi:hypothetical protein